MATTDNEIEILEIVRSIRDSVDSLPNRVADHVADRFKRGIAGPAQAGKSEVQKEQPSGAPHAVNATKEEFASLQIELAEITQQRDKAQSDLDGLVSKLADHEARLGEILQETAAAEVKAADAAGRKSETEAEITRLRRDVDVARKELKELADHQQGLEAELTEAHAVIAAAEPVRQNKEAADKALAELEERRAEFEGYRKAGETAHLLLERIWPDWLRTGALTDWKLRIEASVFDDASPPSFGLLFAAVHTYNAALRDSDPKTLHDSLRDVGRRLYAWLRDLGHSDADSAATAEQWAEAINREFAGRGEIEVPIPGNAANNQWMIFQPRGGSSPDVASVRSWCVRDAQKRPVHRAEVTV